MEEENPVPGSRRWVTAIVVHMQPVAAGWWENAAAASVLEAFTSVVHNVVADHGGMTVALKRDTSAGVFRGAGDSVYDVHQAVEAAFAVMERLSDKNQRRRSQNRQPLRVGIGIHSGQAAPGTPAEQFATLTQKIDKAEGLSILNRQTPFPAIFISQNALKRLDGGRDYHIQPLGETALHNLEETIRVYALMYALQPA